MTNRESFEAFCAGYNDLQRHPADESIYRDPETEGLWLVWQESRKQALGEVLGVLENHSQGPAVQVLAFLGYKKEK